MRVTNTEDKPIHKFFYGFFLVYLVACGFQHLFHLPVLADKFQLPEIIFIIGMVSFAVFNKQSIRLTTTRQVFNSPVVLICTAWLLVHLISFGIHPCIEGFLECLGIGYLIILFYCMQWGFECTCSSILKQKITSAFILFGWMMSIAALVAYLLSVYVDLNTTAQVYYNYPYFGDRFRLQGFTTTPAMYVSVISLPIGFSLYRHLFVSGKKMDLVAALFFTVVSFLTLSKSLLFIAVIWFILFGFKYQFFKKISLLISVFLLLAHVLLTHFLFLTEGQASEAKWKNGPYTSNESILKYNQLEVYGSGYYIFKASSWKIFKENFLFGIGPGQYNLKIEQLKSNKEYPENLPPYDPHSNWTGTLAITGISGFLVFLLIVISMFRSVLLANPSNDWFSFLLLLLLAIAFAESISMDIMNFRHYWILAAIIYLNYKQNTAMKYNGFVK